MSEPREPEPQRIGRYDVRIAFEPPSPEAKARWERRIDTLAAWLLNRWEAERREEQHGCARIAG